MPTDEGRFDLDPRSVGAARAYVLSQLTAWGAPEFEWTAGQVVTELATNAVLHARTAFRVRLDLTGNDTLRIAVSDGSIRVPMQRPYSKEATTGRGLVLVDRLADRWGVDSEAAGKTVWCEIPANPAELDVEPDLDAYLDPLDDAIGHGAERLRSRGRSSSSPFTGRAAA